MLLEFGGGLEVVARHDHPWQVIVDPHGHGLVAIRVDEAGRRCRLGLVFFEGARIVEVSRDPHAWFGALRTAAHKADEHPDRWAAAAATCVDRFAVDQGWWDRRREGRPEHIALAAAWPLLRRSDFAVEDPTSLPRWAARLCEGPDIARASARSLANGSSRRVTRLIGQKLAGRQEWWPLALVLAMPRLDTGQVGDILDALEHEHRCDDSQFARLARTLGTARPDHAIRLLQSVARDGSPQRLLDGLDGLSRAHQLIPRLPTSISALEEAVAGVLVPQPPPTRPQPARRRARIAAAPAAARPTTTAPTHRTPPTAPDQFDHPASWVQLDGATVGDIELVLPTSSGELQRWGRELRNCLGAYNAPVESGRRLVLGIKIQGRLAGAVEVDPARRSIVQVEAADNRPLPRTTRQTITAMLLARGAIARA